MKKQWISLSLIAGLGLFTMASCGSDTVEEAREQAQELVDNVADSVSDEVVEIAIEGDDAMQFNVNQLHAKAGQTVKLTLTHTGELDKSVMGHNVVILKQGTDVEAFASAALDAKDNDHIPASHEGDIIAHTDLIGGGESTTITFTAPEAGTYDFICSFPGHAGMMKGKFIVQ